MFEQFVYDELVKNLTALALQENENQRIFWENRRDSWLQLAAICRANKQPLPEKPFAPARMAKVVSALGTSDQSTITVTLGPELVADPKCELAPIPSFLVGDFPANFQAVGVKQGDSGVWSALPRDTVEHGTRVVYQGRRLEKVEDIGFGGLRRSYYRDLGAA